MKNVEDFLKAHTNSNIKKTTEKKNNISNIEEFDKEKTKVLKYVLYKKRTEQEVRQKFSSSLNENLLEDIIENLKENGYINDENYIEKAVKEFIAINTLSIKQIKNKLYNKGLNNYIIDTYFNNHQESLQLYEINCAKKIILKKQSQMEKEEIENFLYKKGYNPDNIKIAFEEI